MGNLDLRAGKDVVKGAFDVSGCGRKRRYNFNILKKLRSLRTVLGDGRLGNKFYVLLAAWEPWMKFSTPEMKFQEH